MFSALYNTGIYGYQFLLRLAAPFKPKARLWVDGRHDWANRLAQQLDGNVQPIAWFHAASLGEFEQGRPVIEAFRVQYPTYKILLTFFSPSGYEVRKTYDGADCVCYLPADTPANARQFVQLVKPQIAFFIKYEFWHNYLRELKAAHIPVVCFSASFRPNQLFFKSYGVGPAHRFYRNMLHCFDHILVQNQQSADLLRSIGITNVTLAGDTRFDRVAETARNKRPIPAAEAFKAGQPLLVVGSAWPRDIDVLIPFLNHFEQPLKVIIAPHEINDAQIERWRGQLTGGSVRYSVLNDRMIELLNETTASHIQSFNHSITQYLLIDNIGLLASLYQYGDFAYIGGAFGEGLHNILEPATFGVPVFFGPEISDFPEATELIQAGGAFSIGSTAEFEKAFRQQYADSSVAAQASHAYVQRNIGATERVMEVVRDIFKRRANRGLRRDR
ncbi:3-deoxy-D-manno-octulosonic acid transferase [Spirosoma montaniterrae]|uniref:3-deoxy-D-manno-octulosonic acid transferase n=1 Tax=Spirosoma montaniterrae TaxID=1178516 RepID=A0A1P9X2H4_9BACT|nr:glycosyltransferase N-terminal domain-containing protein [Spirosoma montaniterrae]AQG81798.1 3-deoxy-D-manno-octulosonic acid transferase [Spirosoma montaniterrae]